MTRAEATEALFDIAVCLSSLGSAPCKAATDIACRYQEQTHRYARACTGWTPSVPRYCRGRQVQRIILPLGPSDDGRHVWVEATWTLRDSQALTVLNRQETAVHRGGIDIG